MALSGGQKQRVAIASAIASSKEIIIFDEPTSGLDLYHMTAFANQVQTLQENRRTVFLITHDFELITKCCSHVLHIHQGRLVDQYALDDESFPKLHQYFQVSSE
jgi:energy-coupling factor transport system ATP-binding protein